MADQERRFDRRHNDRDGLADRLIEYRAVAEEAYRRYLRDGCARERILDYWQEAELHVRASALSK